MAVTGETAAVAAIPALAQTGFGAYQTAKGNKILRGLEDPTYEVPASIEEILSLSRLMAANPNMPGYDKYLENLAQIMAAAQYGISQSATSSAEALGAINKAVGAQTRGAADIAIANAEDYQRRQQNVIDALRLLAGAQDKQFDINVQQPFLRRAAAGQGMVGAGLQNIYGGVNAASGIGASYLAANPRSTTDTAVATTDTTGERTMSVNDLMALIKKVDKQESRPLWSWTEPAPKPTMLGPTVPYATPSGQPGQVVEQPVIPWWTNFDN